MRKKKVVVYIENEEDMLELGKLILERAGFEFVGAWGGEEGWKTIQRVHPDVVLLDLMMPDVDGWEVYRRLRADEQLKDTPVIVVTAVTGSIDRVFALKIAKVDGYVMKPFGINSLVQAIEQVLEKRDAYERQSRGNLSP